MYVGLCVFVDGRHNQKDFYLQHLWMASDSLEDMCGLRVIIDKEVY